MSPFDDRVDARVVVPLVPALYIWGLAARQSKVHPTCTVSVR